MPFAPSMAHHSIRDDLINTANQFDILYQLVVNGQDGADGAAMQVACDGVPDGNLRIPCRYIHSTSEFAYLTDGDYTIILLIQHLRKRK